MKLSSKKIIISIASSVVILSLSNCHSISKSQSPVSVKSTDTPAPFTVKNSSGETLTLSPSEGFVGLLANSTTGEMWKVAHLEDEMNLSPSEGFVGLLTNPATGQTWTIDKLVNTSL